MRVAAKRGQMKTRTLLDSTELTCQKADAVKRVASNIGSDGNASHDNFCGVGE